MTNEEALEAIKKIMNDSNLDFTIIPTYNVVLTPKKQPDQKAPEEITKIIDVETKPV